MNPTEIDKLLAADDRVFLSRLTEHAKDAVLDFRSTYPEAAYALISEKTRRRIVELLTTMNCVESQVCLVTVLGLYGGDRDIRSLGSFYDANRRQLDTKLAVALIESLSSIGGTTATDLLEHIAETSENSEIKVLADHSAKRVRLDGDYDMLWGPDQDDVDEIQQPQVARFSQAALNNHSAFDDAMEELTILQPGAGEKAQGLFKKMEMEFRFPEED